MNYHPVIGILISALLIVQPVIGFFHHKDHKRDHRRGFWSALHLILGRTAITVGMVNGYLGLMATDSCIGNIKDRGTRQKQQQQKQRFKTAYVTVALVFWILWTGLSMWWEWRRHRMEKAEKELERALNEDGTGVGADRRIHGISNGRLVNDRTGTRGGGARRKARKSRSRG